MESCPSGLRSSDNNREKVCIPPKGFQVRAKCIVSNWRLVRVVEGARLESVYTRKGIKGSNPLVSAKCIFDYILQSKKGGSFYVGQCDDLDRRMGKH